MIFDEDFERNFLKSLVFEDFEDLMILSHVKERFISDSRCVHVFETRCALFSGLKVHL